MESQCLVCFLRGVEICRVLSFGVSLPWISLTPPQSQHFLDYQNINLAINLRANVQQNGNLWKKSTHELSGK